VAEAAAPVTADRADDALVIEAVSRSFVTPARTITALKNVSARVREGQVTGLIGPDAAGKTTLMRLAAGLLAPDSGRLLALGMDATGDALRVQSALGYMPQRFGLYEDLTVQENLDLYADLQGVAPAKRPARYRELMDMTGLGPFTGRLAGRLSGGMKQKLGLACTLVRFPALLLLDEPTVGVDPVSRRELWTIVYRLVREQRMTVLLSTAYLDEAERCDRVLILHDGELLGEGPPAQFSASLKGRTFHARAPERKKRDLQHALDEAPGVLDAVIQGDGVRVVLAPGRGSGAAAELPDATGARFVPVPPRFEDGFVTLLNRNRQGDRATVEVEHTRSGGTDGPVIEVSGLERRFGDFYAVKGLSFTVDRGEIFGLLGANGAGKSTTFRMLCGLLPASAGRVQVAGVDLRRAPASARSRIGYMSQKFSLYASLSVAQNLTFFASAYDLRGRHRRERIDWVVAQFELDGLLEVPSGELSLGYKQRLAMAAALMHDPDILFLDEPTSGVDPLARREFWRHINALARAGVTVLVTTHFMEEAEYCDRVAIMASGGLLSLGTPERIKADTRTDEHPEPTMEEAFIALIEAPRDSHEH